MTGHILEADAEHVYVLKEMREGGMAYVVPKETVISRNQIVSVDHPGNILLTVGLITTAVGAGILKGNAGDCGAFTMEIPCQATHVPLIAGIGMSLWGLVVWLRSTGAYSPKAVRVSPPRMGPRGY